MKGWRPWYIPQLPRPPCVSKQKRRSPLHNRLLRVSLYSNSSGRIQIFLWPPDIFRKKIEVTCWYLWAISQCCGWQVYRRFGESGCRHFRNVGWPARHNVVLPREFGKKNIYSAVVSWVVILCDFVRCFESFFTGNSCLCRKSRILLSVTEVSSPQESKMFCKICNEHSKNIRIFISVR